ncbi:MAG: hypothetical protein F6K21_12325 [Symploca sp. SIO2D2]|nr:hypothetical protein [Symploca sp. SIO2D2]
MLLKRAYAIRPYGKCDRIARDEIPTVISPKNYSDRTGFGGRIFHNGISVRL